MPTLQDQMILDVEANILNSSLMGESIIYISKLRDYIEDTQTPTAGEKTINALVVRTGTNPSKIDEKLQFPINGLRFYVSRGSSNGIQNVRERFDKVKIPLKRGGSATEFRVTKVISETSSLWFLQAEE